MGIQDSGNVQAGEAGHAGQDRQPVKNPGHKETGTAPEGAQAASAGQVQKRSDEAQKGNQGSERADMVHPGPDREEAEKSKGGAHHNMKEKEPEMGKKVEKL